MAIARQDIPLLIIISSLYIFAESIIIFVNEVVTKMAINTYPLNASSFIGTLKVLIALGVYEIIYGV